MLNILKGLNTEAVNGYNQSARSNVSIKIHFTVELTGGDGDKGRKEDHNKAI